MIIDFKQAQIAQFQQLVQKLMQHPEQYLAFEQISDFYRAAWLSELPQVADYVVSGLDDGGENFEVKIQVYHHILRFSYDGEMQVRYQQSAELSSAD